MVDERTGIEQMLRNLNTTDRGSRTRPNNVTKGFLEGISNR